MNRYAIIVAGGKGLRMGGDVPKQFLPVKGRPVLMRTLEAFHGYDDSIRLILVLPESQQAYWSRLCGDYGFDVPHRVVNGGETRFHSVANGLALVPANEKDALVAVHDGVRPFVSPEVLTACYEGAEACAAVVPVTDVVETLRRVTDEKTGASETVSRTEYRSVQTPQVFRADILKAAYAQPYNPFYTDDASVAEASGFSVKMVPGSRENIKITTPFDLKIAEAFLS